jgi:hypothetical protein
MKNKGINLGRIATNYLERVFAERWEDCNTKINPKSNWLEQILAATPNHPKLGEVSPRDREVAATIIQWLGTPVGQEFIRDCLSMHLPGLTESEINILKRKWHVLFTKEG